MRFGDIAKKAKEQIDKRGGVDALKADAEELKNIARGSGTLSEKAKKAAAAVKDPGEQVAEETAQADPRPAASPASGPEATPPGEPTPPSEPPPSGPPEAGRP